MTSRIVLDANIAVWAAIPGPRTEQAITFLENAGMILVPGLWVYEVTSALHKVLQAKGVPASEAWAVLTDTLTLADEVVPADEEMARTAYQWAERLGQVAAYDGFCLALAEQWNLPLWTADRRLCHQAQTAGANFVRCFPEDWEATRSAP